MMEDHEFVTSDGVKLHYAQITNKTQPTSDAKEEHVLLLLPGWSQTTNQFVHQLNYFSSNSSLFRRTLALDPRGHGMSDKPAFGYRLSRLAHDVHDWLQHLRAENKHTTIRFHVLAHSAHCCVLWTYATLFDADDFASMVWVDQMVCYIKQSPDWSEEECNRYGTKPDATYNELKQFLNTLMSTPPSDATLGFLKSMFSPNAKLDAILADNLKFPREYAVRMAWQVMSEDFRDVIEHQFKTTKVPVLCVGGNDSHIPIQCAQWQSSQVKCGEFVGLPGTHFMFYEQHEAFNKAVQAFFEKVIAH